VFAYTVSDCATICLKTIRKEMKSRPTKQWLDQLRHEKRFGFPEKLENVYVFKEHLHADCFETKSWVEIYPKKDF